MGYGQYGNLGRIASPLLFGNVTSCASVGYGGLEGMVVIDACCWTAMVVRGCMECSK